MKTVKKAFGVNDLIAVMRKDLVKAKPIDIAKAVLPRGIGEALGGNGLGKLFGK